MKMQGIGGVLESLKKNIKHFFAILRKVVFYLLLALKIISLFLK